MVKEYSFKIDLTKVSRWILNGAERGALGSVAIMLVYAFTRDLNLAFASGVVVALLHITDCPPLPAQKPVKDEPLKNDSKPLARKR